MSIYQPYLHRPMTGFKNSRSLKGMIKDSLGDKEILKLVEAEFVEMVSLKLSSP